MHILDIMLGNHGSFSVCWLIANARIFEMEEGTCRCCCCLKGGKIVTMADCRANVAFCHLAAAGPDPRWILEIRTSLSLSHCHKCVLRHNLMRLYWSYVILRCNLLYIQVAVDASPDCRG